MIELLDRKNTLRLNKTFASAIVDFQHVQYNPDSPDNIYEPGEMYMDDSDEPRFVSQKECDELNREARREYEIKRDVSDVISIKDNFAGTLIYSAPNSDIDTYELNLANSINKLSAGLKWDSVIVILDYSTPWLSQENDYKPADNALKYLKSLGVDKDFVGGFKISGVQLTEFFQHLFWITRCNASLPYCYFSGVNNRFVATICKYGNVHFDFYSDDEKNEFKKVAEQIGLVRHTDNNCYENFSDTGEIKGRQIII